MKNHTGARQSDTSMRLDLNCDLGEGFGAYDFGQDEALLRVVSSANIACGFHAGDPHTMRRTVDLCLRAGTAIGAHPGLPDRLGFGRREMAVTPEEVYDFTVYQIGALYGFVRAAGGTLSHVKPHGALYHMAGRSKDIADAVIRAVQAVDPMLFLYAQSGSLLIKEAGLAGLPAVSEVFADRRYRADGSLVPRQFPDALVEEEEEAVRQAVGMAVWGEVRSQAGTVITVQADSLCVHGDGKTAVKLAESIRGGLLENQVKIVPPARII